MNPRHLSPVAIVCTCERERGYANISPLSTHRILCARVQDAIDRLHITNIRDRRLRLINPFAEPTHHVDSAVGWSGVRLTAGPGGTEGGPRVRPTSVRG